MVHKLVNQECIRFSEWFSRLGVSSLSSLHFCFVIMNETKNYSDYLQRFSIWGTRRPEVAAKHKVYKTKTVKNSTSSIVLTSSLNKKNDRKTPGWVHHFNADKTQVPLVGLVTRIYDQGWKMVAETQAASTWHRDQRCSDVLVALRIMRNSMHL